ncbi:AraC family transcriptional regulator ligand-binding domain-containing protein [Rhodanobacter sp. AS-Z3]|uniref:AraC family transcriptional regulator n=1 Tax=Rhodanobacter sp. AS-Z3 TaxID=3031330 RepID=UPI00247A339C|nr:AraC family transcriptional regulator [Rhodanobacter sp. AS-Z3]WEN13421.1 AraC family transcriptional regulator ligand-binding domain-containing protein [Rhodanobacter sp. AS-Z3]
MQTANRTISPAFVRLLHDYVQSLGLDAWRVLGEARPAESPEQAVGFPMAHWVELLRRASQHMDDPLLGLRIGQTIEPRHLGTLGFLLQSLPTLGAAMQKLQRYQRLVYDQTPMLQLVEADYVDLVWGIDQGQPGSLADDTSITALIYYCRAIAAGPVIPQYVQFVNPAPRNCAAYRAAYGCPVEFTAPVTRVRFSSATLALPLRAANADLSTLMERQTEQLLALWPTPDEPFVAHIRTAIGALLHDGEPTLPRVAERLAVTPRTAQRHLQQAGTSFRTELETVRRQMAEIYLRDARLSVADIALLLGYSEHSALTRSYRQWTGQAPRPRR